VVTIRTSAPITKRKAVTETPTKATKVTPATTTTIVVIGRIGAI